MGMPTHQLVPQTGHHLLDGEPAILAGHLGMEQHLQQHVAELIPDGPVVALVDGFQELVGFLQGIPFQRRMGLLPIPGAPVPAPQTGHHPHELLEQLARVLLLAVIHERAV